MWSTKGYRLRTSGRTKYEWVYAYEFARLGCGIARTSDLLAAPDLATGTVVQVLPEVYSEEPVSIVYLPDPTPTVRRFVDFVVEFSRAAAEQRLAAAEAVGR